MARMRRRPASSDENREIQLVSLAYDLAEKQLLEGTASSQVMTHFLKSGSTRDRLERDRLQRENELLTAKVEQLASSKRVEELYAAALEAMSTYSGNSHDPIDDEFYDD